MVGNQITNFLRDVPYQDEPILWNPEQIHYTPVRGKVIEIIEVEVAENNGKLLNLNRHGETQPIC